ncbi:hypothetical protein RvY_06827-3 [Ramazzottius varieornatus]|uniref:Uncharacterized protein n=1 Tax=Ramazzottius varieornatus TaxID=947166 RepID=A0A1D1V8J9_RAMVA|nr:hypothetical protein RvY_06827-3 [Ramazzottius varieornatus]
MRGKPFVRSAILNNKSPSADHDQDWLPIWRNAGKLPKVSGWKRGPKWSSTTVESTRKHTTNKQIDLSESYGTESRMTTRVRQRSPFLLRHSSSVHPLRLLFGGAAQSEYWTWWSMSLVLVYPRYQMTKF